MKLFKIIIVFLLITSCESKSIDDECNCIKTTYEYEQGVTTGSNGLPHMTFQKVILSNETVNCQDEQTQTEQGNGIYFDIECR